MAPARAPQLHLPPAAGPTFDAAEPRPIEGHILFRCRAIFHGEHAAQPNPKASRHVANAEAQVVAPAASSAEWRRGDIPDPRLKRCKALEESLFSSAGSVEASPIASTPSTVSPSSICCEATLEQLEVPILRGVRVGHGYQSQSTFVGAMAFLDAAAGTLTISKVANDSAWETRGLVLFGKLAGGVPRMKCTIRLSTWSFPFW